jgi:hypothetical protein
MSTNDKDYIKNVVDTVLSQSDYDICYLSKYLDACYLYTDRKQIGSGDTSIVSTYKPKGLQAVLLTRKCIQYILSNERLPKSGKLFKPSGNSSLADDITKLISHGELRAFAVVPNLFDFDINRATNPTDYMKTTECAPPPFNRDLVSGHESMFGSYVVLFILIILIIVGIYLVARKHPQ